MKYAIISSPRADAQKLTKKTEDHGGWWVRFGDTQLIYSANDAWGDVARATGTKSKPDGSIRKGDMHLVVQKGRTFQQAHPDIPVILDKGRYLVVDLPRSKVGALRHKDEVCFDIEPLRENSTVFEEVTPAPATGARQEAADLVAGLTESTFTSALAQLVSYPTRLSTSAGYTQAADWCESQLLSWGYDVNQQTVTLPGGVTSTNVIARKTGHGADPQCVISVAHLDSVNHPGGPTAPAPGADDNGSGAAGIMTLAHAMAEQRFEHDLMFILFGGEEQGLHGSLQYVSGLSSAEKLRVQAVVNMDMIGHVNTAAPTVLLEGASLSQDVIDGLAAAAAQFTTLSVQSSLNPFASDHVPFINANIPAVLTIEGADGANDAIHTGNDTLDRVDPGFAMDILRMNAGFLAQRAGIMAVSQPQEQDGDCGCGCAGCGPSAATQALAGHYQALLAQYARLGAAGQLGAHDMQTWQALHNTHARLTDASTQRS